MSIEPGRLSNQWFVDRKRRAEIHLSEFDEELKKPDQELHPDYPRWKLEELKLGAEVFIKTIGRRISDFGGCIEGG